MVNTAYGKRVPFDNTSNDNDTAINDMHPQNHNKIIEHNKIQKNRGIFAGSRLSRKALLVA